MMMTDKATREHAKVMAKIVVAEPFPEVRPERLALAAWAIFEVTIQEDEGGPAIYTQVGACHANPEYAFDEWFDGTWNLAGTIAPVLAVQKFKVPPAKFPGRLALFCDEETTLSGVPIPDVGGSRLAGRRPVVGGSSTIGST
jgi:hypothetical protein